MVTTRIFVALAVAVALVATAAALDYAQDLGTIGGDTARRTTQVLIGVILAVYGNFMPKDVIRARASARAAARSQSALRLAGWAMTLAGLGHATLWAFAPIAVADVAAAGLVAAATLLTIGYGGWVLIGCRRDRTPRAV